MNYGFNKVKTEKLPSCKVQGFEQAMNSFAKLEFQTWLNIISVQMQVKIQASKKEKKKNIDNFQKRY